MSLTGKTVLITGATSGFGRACAILCAKAGARIIATGRRADRLEALKKEILSLRGEAEAIHASTPKDGSPRRSAPRDDGMTHTLTFDVRHNDEVKAAFASLPPDFANVDILINNAGLALGFVPYEQQPMAYLEQMVDTNIKGMMYCTHALLPGMIARNLGHIVNLGSVAGNYPYPGGNVYGGTKGFVKQFSLNLRADLLGKNIRVTNIEPGMAETEFSLVRFAGDESKAGDVYKGIQPLSPDDVAEAILWCLTRPAHVNVNRMEIMPTQQAFSAFAVHRDS